MPTGGRLAQWQSVPFTSERSLVRSQQRPPIGTHFSSVAPARTAESFSRAGSVPFTSERPEVRSFLDPRVKRVRERGRWSSARTKVPARMTLSGWRSDGDPCLPAGRPATPTMKNFLRPTKQKFRIFFLLIPVAIILVAIALLARTPILVLFITVPIRFFDFITAGAFKPGNCGFICFPTLPQISFVLIFDVVLLYVVACVISWFRSRRSES